jgi:hypothetical protein
MIVPLDQTQSLEIILEGSIMDNKYTYYNINPGLNKIDNSYMN